MAQQLTVLTTLPDDLDLIASTHMVLTILFEIPAQKDLMSSSGLRRHSCR